jgi:hypothetical protein
MSETVGQRLAWYSALRLNEFSQDNSTPQSKYQDPPAKSTNTIGSG